MEWSLKGVGYRGASSELLDNEGNRHYQLSF